MYSWRKDSKKVGRTLSERLDKECDNFTHPGLYEVLDSAFYELY